MRARQMFLYNAALLLFGGGALYSMAKGTIDAPEPGWQPAGAEITVTANPTNFYYVVWSGDTNGAQIVENEFQFTVDRARNVDAEFQPHVTDAYTIPWWWLAQFDPESDTWDAEQFEDMVFSVLEEGAAPVWQAYLTGTDPQDPESRFAISKVSVGEDGRVQLQWTHAEHADPDLPPVMIEFREDLMEGDWDVVGEIEMQQEIVWDHDHDSDVRGYYRLRVNTP